MAISKTTLGTLAILGLLIGLVAGSAIVTYTWNSTGTIIATRVEVYFKDELMSISDSIVWGNLPNGSQTTGNLTIVNIGTTNFTIRLRTINMPVYLNTTWAGNNTTLHPTERAMGDLILMVDPLAPPEPFTFQYNLTLTEVS